MLKISWREGTESTYDDLSAHDSRLVYLIFSELDLCLCGMQVAGS
jgi:hypothetical protein